MTCRVAYVVAASLLLLSPSVTAQQSAPSVGGSGSSEANELQVYAVTRLAAPQPPPPSHSWWERFVARCFRAMRGIGAVEYPGEALLFVDIISPRWKRHYLPADQTDYDSIDNSPIGVSILLEYAERDFPKAPYPPRTDGAMKLIPRAIIGDLDPAARGQLLWTRSQRAGCEVTKATLFIHSRVRSRRTGSVGALHMVQTFVLRHSTSPPAFQWVADMAQTDFIPDLTRNRKKAEEQ